MQRGSSNPNMVSQNVLKERGCNTYAWIGMKSSRTWDNTCWLDGGSASNKETSQTCKIKCASSHTVFFSGPIFASPPHQSVPTQAPRMSNDMGICARNPPVSEFVTIVSVAQQKSRPNPWDCQELRVREEDLCGGGTTSTSLPHSWNWSYHILPILLANSYLHWSVEATQSVCLLFSHEELNFK